MSEGSNEESKPSAYDVALWIFSAGYYRLFFFNISFFFSSFFFRPLIFIKIINFPIFIHIFMFLRREIDQMPLYVINPTNWWYKTFSWRGEYRSKW